MPLTFLFLHTSFVKEQYRMPSSSRDPRHSASRPRSLQVTEDFLSPWVTVWFHFQLGQNIPKIMFGDLLSATRSKVSSFAQAVRDFSPEEYFLITETESLMKGPCPVKSFLHWQTLITSGSIKERRIFCWKNCKFCFTVITREITNTGFQRKE
jgi:hypothetical protein